MLPRKQSPGWAKNVHDDIRDNGVRRDFLSTWYTGDNVGFVFKFRMDLLIPNLLLYLQFNVPNKTKHLMNCSSAKVGKSLHS